MQRTRIFGTPPEPVFNMTVSGLTPDVLEEILYVLADENEKNMDCINEHKGYFKGGQSAEYIFLLSEEMELPTETRFHALELFDKFMVKHVCDLYEVIRSSDVNQQHDWNVVEERLKTQLPLRAVSCLQIASKMVSHCKSMSANKARRFLNSIGHRYTIESVLKSEMRVLKTLEYHLMITTPLNYLETILEILGHNDGTAQVKLLHEASVKILDIMYLKHHEIYSQLCMFATGEQCHKEDRHKLAIISSDLMLQAVAIISAASYIIKKSTSDMVVEQLSRITQIPENDILDFATILIEHIL